MDNSLNFQYNLASCSPFKDNSPKTIQRICFILIILIIMLLCSIYFVILAFEYFISRTWKATVINS